MAKQTILEARKRTWELPTYGWYKIYFTYTIMCINDEKYDLFTLWKQARLDVLTILNP